MSAAKNRRLAPAELGALDGKRLRERATKAGRTLTAMGAANTTMGALLARIEKGQCTPDDAVTYGLAYLNAALNPQVSP